MQAGFYLRQKYHTAPSILDVCPNIPFPQIRFFEPGYDYHIVPPGQLSSKLLDYLLALVSLSKGSDGCKTG
jgi:hypothetical protein